MFNERELPVTSPYVKQQAPIKRFEIWIKRILFCTFTLYNRSPESFKVGVQVTNLFNLAKCFIIFNDF
ncbi:unnamed protein product [Rhizophagus irregularis]|nr:unnamed protein product [Rhizophagus irregularis]CAB5374122.1 unnamed protein product [Rhizophagus irregularis]